MSDLEARILELGEPLVVAARRGGGGFGQGGFTGKLVESVMADPAFKVEAFRFVDVLPTLRDADEVARHIDEYFNRKGGPPMPTWMTMGAKVAGSGIGAGIFADQVERNVKTMARNFIAGETGIDCLPTLRALRQRGLAITVDLLGEKTMGMAEAGVYRDRYLEVLDALAADAAQWPGDALETASWGPVPPVNISIKLSALDPHFDCLDRKGLMRTAEANLVPILQRARELGAFVNVDMEDDAHREATLWLFEKICTGPTLGDYPHLGIVSQAYLVDAQKEAEQLLDWVQGRGAPITVRLVKGAYWDQEVIQAQQEGWSIPVYTHKADSDANFERMTRFLIDHADALRPAIASHNARSIAAAMAYGEAKGLARSDLEFQMLFGMAEGLMEAVREQGYRLRVYTPVGELLPGMSYLVRRLLENTSNEGWLVASAAGQSAAALLAAPEDAGGRADREKSHTREPPEAAEDEPGPFANEPVANFHHFSTYESFRNAADAFTEHLPLTVQPWIDGQWLNEGECRWRRENPSQINQVVADVIGASIEQGDRALTSAQAAQPAWAAKGVEVRAAMLRRLAAAMRARRHELTACMMVEVGKPAWEADADVAEAIDFCEYYAREALKLQRGQALQVHVPGEDNLLSFRARGVAVVIAPWNFPLAILCGMSTAALVMGNSVLIKPAEQSSAIAKLFFDLLLEVGLPNGVAHFLPGRGETLGASLVADPRTSIVAFTGSKAVGLSIIETAAKTSEGQSQVRRVICEMGGKNAILVDDDADLDEAVTGVLQSAFGFAGQKCSACSRVVVLSKAYDEFCTRLADGVAALRVGGACQPALDLGPVVDQEAYERTLSYIDLAQSEGTLLAQADVPEGGYFPPPTVVKDITPSHRIANEEVFGPVVAVMRAESYEQAIEWVNATPYALTAGLYSRSPARIAQARDQLEVGNLYINRGCTGAIVERHPFGGFKMSGLGGKAGGPDYLQQFADGVAVAENTLRSGFAPDVGLTKAPATPKADAGQGHEAKAAAGADLGLLFLRVSVGAFMLLGHGWPKLANFAAKSAHFPDPLGVGSSLSLSLAIVGEVLAPLLIILGLFTRLATVPLIITMVVAAVMVHGGDPWAKKEFALLYALPAIALLFTGAGRHSLDARWRQR
ncbi:MAG: 1-pyrroline-5-carboxylate dehydrogenase [Myxococcales bacterium]|nr:1-pyrroline-5-carboxylate dehydrogenase [Myxococcales bacterium]